MAPGRQRLNAAQTQETSAADDQSAELQGTAARGANSAEPKQDQSQTNGQGVDPNKGQSQIIGQGADPNKDQSKTDGQDTGKSKVTGKSKDTAETGEQKSEKKKKKKKAKPQVDATDQEQKQLENAVVLLKLWVLTMLDPVRNYIVDTPYGPITYANLLLCSIASALHSLRQELLDDIKRRTGHVVNSLRFIDDEFFRVAANGQMELIQALLRDITGDDNLTLKSIQVQMDFSFPKKYHSIVADVFCVTTNNELIILEIQKEGRKETYPRSMFEGYAVGFNSLASGESYKNLKPVYVVFLTNTDVFNSGELLHIGEEAHFVPGVESDVKPLFKTFYLNCAYVQEGNDKVKRKLVLEEQRAKETENHKKGWLGMQIKMIKKFQKKRKEAKKSTMKQYGIDDARWNRLETWGCDFMATDSADISRKDMAEIMRLIKETGEEEVNVMSSVVYQAIKKNLEETLKEGIEKGREENRESTARVLVESGVDLDIILKATGYSLEELASLMAFPVK